MIQERDYLAAKLKEAGVKSAIYTNMKKLRMAGEPIWVQSCIMEIRLNGEIQENVMRMKQGRGWYVLPESFGQAVLM